MRPVNQPTAAPTRKVTAMMVTLALCNVASALIADNVPGFGTVDPAQLETILQSLAFGITCATGYMVRERAP